MSVIHGEWKTGETIEVTLPSGLRVKLKKITLGDAGIVDEVDDLLDIRICDIPTLAWRFRDLELLLNEVARFSLLDPMVGDVPDDNHITLAELSRLDKQVIFMLAKEVKPQIPIRSRKNLWRLDPRGEAFRRWQSN